MSVLPEVMIVYLLLNVGCHELALFLLLVDYHVMYVYKIILQYPCLEVFVYSTGTRSIYNFITLSIISKLQHQ